jgi:hypothetical protein
VLYITQLNPRAANNKLYAQRRSRKSVYNEAEASSVIWVQQRSVEYNPLLITAINDEFEMRIAISLQPFWCMDAEDLFPKLRTGLI